MLTNICTHGRTHAHTDTLTQTYIHRHGGTHAHTHIQRHGGTHAHTDTHRPLLTNSFTIRLLSLSTVWFEIKFKLSSTAELQCVITSFLKNWKLQGQGFAGILSKYFFFYPGCCLNFILGFTMLYHFVCLSLFDLYILWQLERGKFRFVNNNKGNMKIHLKTEYFNCPLNEENVHNEFTAERSNLQSTENMNEGKVKDVIAATKRNKALGPDGVPTDAWKHAGAEGGWHLKQINRGQIVEDGILASSNFKKQRKNKKGNILECRSRSIKLMPHTLDNFGFMSGWSATDPIH